MKRILLRTIVMIVSIVMIAAAAISWNGLTNLALISGFHENIAWLAPIVIDGCIILSTAFILYLSLDNKRSKLAYFTLLFGTGFSIWGNIQSSNVQTVTGYIVHTIAPLGLFLAVEILGKIIRSRFDIAIMNAKIQEAQEKARQAELDKEVKRAESARKRLENKTDTHTPKTTPEVRRTATKALEVSETRIAELLPQTNDEEVTEIKNIDELSIIDHEGLKKTDVIRNLLEQNPNLSNSEIATIMNVETKTIATSIGRVKARIKTELAS